MKAIETSFNGYRFRSRLEARWAVFFQALDIAYRYEAEGYAFQGVTYLPDFYLPHYDCFVEIKGQQPTAEEHLKAKLLALYSGKRVYTFAGDIWVPGEQGSYHGIADTPPRLTHGNEVPDAPLEEPPLFETMIQLPPALVEAVPKLQARGLTLLFYRDQYDPERDDGKDEFSIGLTGHFAHFDHPHLAKNLSDHLLYLQDQQRLLEQHAPLLLQEEPTLRHISACLDAYIPYELQQYRVDEPVVWAECTACNALEVVVFRYAHLSALRRHWCPSSRLISRLTDPPGKTQGYTHCSPRLLAAYTAARSARFERGEHH